MIGLYLDELEIGRIIPLGSHHFTRDAIVDFARTYDPQPFHLDEEAGRRGPFGVLSASGWHTAAGWMKCYVATNQAADAKLRAAGKTPAPLGPSPGFENLVWHKPVKPGDTITYTLTVTGKRALASRPGWGLLFSHSTGVNQDGDEVFAFDGKVMTPVRPSSG
jgi:acyl dehydratase